MSLISIKKISKYYQNKRIVNDVNLDILQNESLAIIGESGSGKSVLIKMISGLILPDSGMISINNKDVSKIRYEDRDDVSVGFVFQHNALFDSLTIEQNISFCKDIKMSKKKTKDRVVQQLELVGLNSNILKLYPSELSGGMQKRVALARTLFYEPKIIFLDEPTSGLDPIMSNIIGDLILKIKDSFNMTLITVTHDMKIANQIGDRIILIKEGQIFAESNNLKNLSKNNNDYIKLFLGV